MKRCRTEAEQRGSKDFTHRRASVIKVAHVPHYTVVILRGIMRGRCGRISSKWELNIFVERLWRSFKYEEVVCCESFIGDGGWPPEVGLQGQASNRHKLRG